MFRETSKAIQMLQEAQLKIEEIYISDDSGDDVLENAELGGDINTDSEEKKRNDLFQPKK